MQLPSELLEHCFHFLTDQRDLYRCATVNRYWFDVACGVLLDDHGILRALQDGRREAVDRIMSINPNNLRFRDLSTAAAFGSERLVRKLLETPAILRQWNCTPIDYHGRSPLVAGIISQNTEVIKLLMPRHTKIMAPDRCGWTPIRAISAMHAEDFTSLARLYKSGQAIAGQEIYKDGYNEFQGRDTVSELQHRLLQLVSRDDALQPLHVAALINSVSMAKAALKQKQDINEQTKRGYTPLALASWEGSFDVASLLVEQGADVMRTSLAGSTPLHVTNHPKIAQLLLTRGMLQVSRPYRQQSLEWTFWGYRSDWRVAGHISPLMRACEAGNGRVVKTLLDAGADPMESNSGGFSTLHAAAAVGLVSAVKQLAHAGVSVNSITRNSSPLHAAAKAGNTEMTRTLIKLGANVHAVTENGLTVMDVAAVVPDLLRVLVDSGLDINSRLAKDGTTIFHTKGTNANDLAAHLGSLVAMGADLSVVDDGGNTALHSAVRHGSLQYVLALQRHGASIEVSNHDGYTPLAIACHCSHQNILKHLIDSRANIDAGGGKALNVACRKNINSVIALLEAGADPELVKVRVNGRQIKRVLKQARENLAKGSNSAFSGVEELTRELF